MASAVRVSYIWPMNISHQSAIVAATLASLAGSALAQLTPDRTYYGINRPVPMKVAIPADAKGDASIQIFVTGQEKENRKASTQAGNVDLAALFPEMWKDAGDPRVLYAQLVVGEQKIGAPVVLQPMTPPAMARPGQGGIQWQAGPKTLSGLRAYVEKHAVLETSMGEMRFAFRPDQAPNTCWNFMELIKGGYYTDIIFHRIMGPREGKPGFMAQVGDPTGTGMGGPGYNIALENSKLPHDFGVLSMARTGIPDTGGSQVFICFSREGTNFLDGNYCSFAQMVSGAEVLDKISKVETVMSEGGEPSKPKDPPKIISAKLIDAPPFGAAKPVTKPTETPAGR